MNDNCIFEYDKAKWIFEYDKTAKDITTAPRFVLGTRGNKPLICIGLNPSTALPDALDMTLKKVEHYAKGYDSWIMLNLYPQRATDPSNINEKLDEELHQRNLKYIREILSQPNASDIWAAWGDEITGRAFLKNCLGDIVGIANKF